MKKLSNKHARFKDAQWYGDNLDITIVGCGGIASWTSLLLSRFGDHELYIYDDDTVDDVNYSGQLFNQSQLGMNKVDAITQTIKAFSGADYIVNSMGRFEEHSFATPIMILALDNMKYRRLAYEKWVEQDDREVLIDGRLLATSYQVITVTKDNSEAYREFLFEDSEVEDVMCSLKQTSHFAAIIGGRIVNILTNYIANKKLGMDIYEVPLFYSENGEMLHTVVRSC